MTAGARVAFTTDWVAKTQLMATERTDPDLRYKKANLANPSEHAIYHRSVVSATFALSVDGISAVGRRRGGRRHRRRARGAEVADEGGIAVPRAGGVREPR